ncbi:hypothetical protein PHYBLDRAFT_145530 [Phycomyces blakesleeanus NRRL 1555(-)]|uniref:Uncharacterized protein n=1 Tax=Phycomyces blakesleeanus (strain ATCC 8743b / DSM 1359 / FGSC 10004 / NBRC 33097 / NRRL 1555) TaxID=763407 RepID=A0A162NGS5_PHYB8|nr:hypothetical protein PHYBLDRAFT_145530 [Phycomyces blakesleeanus NRRL 1555(-)]OAD74068.1 hypothetical protein PHYBLDRAFT_145530 [Phycomyces blakesleeanus NRRL 1555(-)]|eukprot:XP_018292108.1 hypothetical protein PHYBLDRAFT_145530 [Phycomyces blakesleeanus NRRL 1555(-)]
MNILNTGTTIYRNKFRTRLYLQLGPLRCYSTQSMERVIGVFSKLIKSKCKGGRNASFLVEQFILHNYVNTTISIQDKIDLIQPKSYGRESYMNLPNDSSGAQLWEPFHRFAHLNNDLVEGLEVLLGSLCFLDFVEVMKEYDATAHDSSVPIVKQQSQNSSTGCQTQSTYAVISVNDIHHQVGLIQYPPNANQFYIANDIIILLKTAEKLLAFNHKNDSYVPISDTVATPIAIVRQHSKEQEHCI